MIPDTNFEQSLINQGYDSGPINGFVYTDMIDTITSLNVHGTIFVGPIYDLTGIEDFISLTY